MVSTWVTLQETESQKHSGIRQWPIIFVLLPRKLYRFTGKSPEVESELNEILCLNLEVFLN